MNQMRIQMAGAARGDLHGRNAMRTNPRRIVLGFQIPFDDRDPPFGVAARR